MVDDDDNSVGHTDSLSLFHCIMSLVCLSLSCSDRLLVEDFCKGFEVG